MSMSETQPEILFSPSHLARIHVALADPVRLRLLTLILIRPSNPEELVRILALDPHTIDKHLRYLRDAGVVSRQRRGGQTPYYSVREAGECPEAQLVHLTLDLLRREPDMHADLTMLKALSVRENEVHAVEEGEVTHSLFRTGLQRSSSACG
jgi:ArsR family transcriptional regulator